jgi:hypothetical protein
MLTLQQNLHTATELISLSEMKMCSFKQWSVSTAVVTVMWQEALMEALGMFSATSEGGKAR